ncbi:MAG TPA: hypothetical protein VG993_10395, partial [Actinomycetota bacterium]|nr:hypothetical protein [Actinomycetota bacterium]
MRPPRTGISAARNSPGRGPTASRTSAPPSPEQLAPLAGPVSVCVDRPLLGLDRAFTYDLPAEIGAGPGSLVQVPFHGRSVRGWVLQATGDVPGRILPVSKLVSPTRWFDEHGLALCRWVSERYVAPLATVIGRATPPRVAAEEAPERRAEPRSIDPRSPASPVLGEYREGADLLGAIAARRPGAWALRPAPEHEGSSVVELVGASLASGRRALVVVPEAVPMPGTARAIVQAFGDRVALLLAGSKRARFRTWLDVQAGRYDV